MDAAAWVVRHRLHLRCKAASAPSLNDRLALRLTRMVGSMWCAYAFAALALISLPDAIKVGRPAIVSWIAQTFLQLVLLSVIIVASNLQGVTAEVRDRETHDDVVDLHNALHDKLDQVLAHTGEIHDAVVPFGTQATRPS